jgi:hypothetical protein
MQLMLPGIGILVITQLQWSYPIQKSTLDELFTFAALAVLGGGTGVLLRLNTSSTAGGLATAALRPPLMDLVPALEENMFMVRSSRYSDDTPGVYASDA